MDDSWQSEWVSNGPIDHDNVSTCFKKSSACCRYEGNSVDSPCASKDDSIESCAGEYTEKSDASLTKPTFKSILQAKKRLQAFSATKHLKRNSKDEKTEDLDKSDKTLPKKSKKAVYPLDKAQAVVQEIEEIKQKEAQEAQQEQKKIDAIMAVAYKTLALKDTYRIRSRSPSSEREQQFKKREIKCRNYRRSDSFKRRSVSPENNSKRSGKLVYPRNWTEYKEQGLTFVKDEELRSKVFPKTKLNAHELVTRVLTFDGPSPLIESLKTLTLEEKNENIPLSFLRITRSKPTVTYSVNTRKNRDSYVTRKQLFHVIPRDRRNIIEKFINSASSRSQFQSRTLTSRPWYAKSWKRSADAECKILENSVGLSFLQTYSDEEEDNEYEEIVNSNTKEDKTIPDCEAPVKEAILNHRHVETELSVDRPGDSDKTITESKERETLTPEEKPDIIEKKKKEEIMECEKEEQKKKHRRKEKTEEVKKRSKERGDTSEKTVKHTEKCPKENTPEEGKKKDKDELIETRKAIKELEDELERRKAIRMEEEKVSKKKKKKKAKRKETSSESEEEERSPKKKKKSNSKKSKYTTEGEESNSDNGKSKKKKKNKRRKDKITRKKDKTKKINPSTKEGTLKKTEGSEGSDSEPQRKKRKSETEIDFESVTAEEARKIKKKARDKSNERRSAKDQEEPPITKKKKPLRQDDENRKKKRESSRECDDFLEQIRVPDDFQKSEERKCSSQIRVPDDFRKSEERKYSSQIRLPEDFQKSEERKYSSQIRVPDDFQKSKERKYSSQLRVSEDFQKSDERQYSSQIRVSDDFQKFEERKYSSQMRVPDDFQKSEERKYSSQIRVPDDFQKPEERKYSSQIRVPDDFQKSEERKCLSPSTTDKSSATKPGRNSRENTGKHEGDVDMWSDKRHKSSRNSRRDSLTSTKSDDGTKKKTDFDRSHDRKRNENLKDKSRSEEDLHRKTEPVRKYSEQLGKNDKCEAGDNVGSSEDVEKKNVSRSRESSRDRRHSVKLESQKESKYKLLSLPKIEPDWANLRNKRSRYRHSDYKEAADNFANEFGDFPLERDMYMCKEMDKGSRRSKDGGKCEIGTPDTEEYRENWEKDSYPIWESDDETPVKAKEKLNSSWESDEEIFERGHQEVKKTRPLGDTLTLDLEIPLNIKPFKRREIIDPDVELLLLKKQSLSLNEERRRLEIEKLRVKELELEVVKEVKSKVKAEKKPKRRRSKDEESERKDSNEKKKDAFINDCLENETAARKKGRWDKRNSSPKTSDPNLDFANVSQIKKEIIDDEDSSTNVSSSTSVNTSAVLENEYEEFMKALTSSPKKLQVKNKAKKDETELEPPRCVTPPYGYDRTSTITTPTDSLNSGKTEVANNVLNKTVEQTPLPAQLASHIVTILPKDIPLIPMPLPKEIKPVPVPSPQIEIDKIPKPLINLSLSANITLDIAPKFTTAPVCSPSASANTLQAVITQSPTLQKLEKVSSEKDANTLQAVITQSPTLQKLEKLSSEKDTNTLQAVITQSPTLQKLEKLSSDKERDIVSFASPLTETSSDSFKDKPNEPGEKQKSTEKPFVFTTMVLPSKRLLNNSNLNLGDSDDEEKLLKPLKKLEDVVEESKTDSAKTTPAKEKPEAVPVKSEVDLEKSKETNKDAKVSERKEVARSRTPQDKDSKRKRSPDRHARRDGSPRRFSRSKREPSPRRRGRESPRRRGHSPKRHSPRRRSPLKRRSPGKRRRSPRSASPKSRRRSSISPRRKPSPRRSPSPKFRASPPRRIKSKSPDKHSFKPSSERSTAKPTLPKSPVTITSPLEGLKRSVADSTISDDLLPQPSVNMEEYTHSPVTQFYDRTLKTLESPKRESLDLRIDQVLGLAKQEPQPIPTTYSNYGYNQFSQFGKVAEPKSNLVAVQQTFNKVVTQPSKSNFVQVGNMVQILPTEDIPMIPAGKISCQDSAPPSEPLPASRPQVKNEKSQIVQVGNMLQIVPADLPLPPPSLPPEPKLETEEPTVSASSPPVVIYEKQSAESTMRLKVAERREEREKRRQEREKRRKEKEKRRKEKEKRRQMRLKQRTENMIKKALELEVEGVEEEREDIVNETPSQWPPLPALVSVIPSREAGKSILVRANSKDESPRIEKRKVVQFADGVRPGEGTSPSGGEELSSPPPRKKLPKEKRYKKTKLQKKTQKKKVKVKIIKKRPDTEESDEDDGLPPPSPPPGSPPPHIFPPRIKPQPQPAINNIQPYLPNVVSIQTSHSHQQLFRPPQLNLIMHPHHPHHGPPPPPHHGPPPPPHHHHPHHHGPPLPPGPPHFHHGPPPPPPHHHGPPPPPGPHHHHGPPPPFHR